MKRIIKPILVCLSVIAMVACSQAQGGRMDRRKIVRNNDTSNINTEAMAKMENDTTAAVELAELNYHDGDKEYNDTVKIGRINIPAKANPTTGYDWQMKVETEDSTILRLDTIAHTTPKRDPSQPIMCGAPSTIRYEFVSEKAGVAKIVFEYKRPWEKENAPIATVVYNITIAE